MKMARITSIDALRAVTLLGILLVHAFGLFGFKTDYNDFSYFSPLGDKLSIIIYVLLASRCSLVFSMLFGVSFYLILKNPQNTAKKFLWRCFLLIMIGILNKIFYTYDALMLYGICGMFLAVFRKFNPRLLFVAFFVLYVISILLSFLCLGDVFLPNAYSKDRYIVGVSFAEICSYPLIRSIEDYFYIVLNGGVFRTLSYFILGYYFAKKGIIDNLEKAITWRWVGLFAIVYFICFLIFGLFRIDLFFSLGSLFGALFYASLFICIYNWKPVFFRFLEPYGRLGLTNYSSQSLIGVASMVCFILPQKISFEYIVLYFVIIYVLQLLVSAIWLKFFRYGPLEWIWRSLTNLKFISPLK